MNQTITLRLRTVLIALLIALALVAAYLLGGLGGSAPPPAQAATTDEAAAAPSRTLKLVGTGEVTAVPDEATFGLRVTAKRDRLEDALDESSSTMRDVLAALGKLGVTKADVQTTGLQMFPEYDYPQYGPPVLTGYRVTQRAEVRVSELRQAGRAVSTAVATGGNAVRVGQIRLLVGDPSEVVERARDAAVADAEAKAQQYAAATGQTLGQVLSLREVPAPSSAGEVPLDSEAFLAKRSVANDVVPVRAGEEDLSLRVEVVWAFGSAGD